MLYYYIHRFQVLVSFENHDFAVIRVKVHRDFVAVGYSTKPPGQTSRLCFASPGSVVPGII